ncbi:MAG: hypothetical protein ACLGXA_25290 [Acidobacteriota bacterium]
MEIPEQKLPKLEPGHAEPGMKLPRVEGVGIKDETPTSEYPKYIAHPVRGQTLARDAEHEKMLLAEITAAEIAASVAAAPASDESVTAEPVSSKDV